MARVGVRSVRLDKWLWAARFFKTRTQACAAVDAGQVRLNAERSKPAKDVRIDDLIVVRVGRLESEVRVRGLSDVRGPAPFAQTLYEETSESRARRATADAARALAPRPDASHKGRPTKKNRRQLERLHRLA